MLYSAVTSEIDSGPSGPGIGAFFDFDGTLLSGFSATEFMRHGLFSGWIGLQDLGDSIVTATRFRLRQIGFSAFVTGTSGMLRGRTEREYEELGENIFSDRLAAAVYPESRALVRAHLRKGHTVAVVSAATRYQIQPLAHDLRIPHILCTQLEVRDGRFTGEVLHPTCYGEGKAVAARRFAKQEKVRLASSYFYTDSEEDLPLLEIVGRPRPTNPTRRLLDIAVQRGWPTRSFRSRGTPGLAEIVRTSLALGSLVPSLLLGAPAGLFNRSKRRAMNVAAATWGELGTALAGVDLVVSGEEHLWSSRPAVFIFNHQSGIDMLLLCKLLRRDFVGVAKQELRVHPLFGPVFALADAVFIDRLNHDRAVDALQPAVETLREGRSIVIAPEGTRSPTPRPGRFKKGAFRLAMAAKVPIVPIVFRNALDALPKHGVVIHPTTVEVVVHPPIPTTRWRHQALDREIEAIHRLFVETLEG